MTDIDKYIKYRLYLNAKNRKDSMFNNFDIETENYMGRIFMSKYNHILTSRGSRSILGEKEKKIIKHVFLWCVGSEDFQGDLRKGLYLASKQGFGKDILLSAIVEFFFHFDYQVSEYTYGSFCKFWFNNDDSSFNHPVKINDISEYGKMKRERESIPFLELMDYREQTNNRRGMLVSSNFTPKYIQEVLEKDKEQKRIYERVKECFNVVIIKDAKSKRIENKVEI